MTGRVDICETTRATLVALSFVVCIFAWTGPAWAARGGAAATVDEIAQDSDGYDPWESWNRAVFSMNGKLEKVFLRPVARAYRAVLPSFLRKAVRNALDNLRGPIILANDLLQGEGRRALTTGKRLVVNSTLGLGGVIDVGSGIGLEKHPEDFGQTLAVWGVGSGPYLVLPFLGPATPRDGVGRIIDSLADPFNVWARETGRDELPFVRFGVDQVDFYAGLLDELESLEETSIDYYASVRSMYRQRRRVEITANGDSDDLVLPDMDYDFDDFDDFDDLDDPEDLDEPR